MHEPLAPLLADGVIEEICGRLKSGKEADLWLVRQGGQVIAAKVYKARHVRSFRNNAGYKEGRQVRDTRTQRAMDRGSRYGQAAAEDEWKAKEADALHTLHAAGVRVPTPVMFYEGVLLMELVVDAHGHPAPRLVDAHVPREQAAALYSDLRAQAVRMLACHLIHGDLSAYNVLLGSSGPVVIDFPQVIGAAHNSQAESFFVRDIENLRRFFAALDPALHARSGDGREIWRAYVRGELTPDFVPSGRSAEPRPHHGQRADEKHRRPPRGPSAPRHGGRAEPERHGPGGRAEPERRAHGGNASAAPHQGKPLAPHGKPAASHHGKPAASHPGRPAPSPHGRPPAQHGRTGAPHRGEPAADQQSRTQGGRTGRHRRRPEPSVPEVLRVVRPLLQSAGTPAATQRPSAGAHPATGSHHAPRPPHGPRSPHGPRRRRGGP